MIPWSVLDSAPIPGGGSLKLKRRGDEFSVMLGDNELMNSRLGGSEEALAALACAAIAGRPDPVVLIGGLGMGFTLRAALAALGPAAKIIVAELVPAVIDWARGPMAAVFGDALSDRRVVLRSADVAALIAKPLSAYDAILLDVDNGPDGLTQQANDRLYESSGLRAARQALRPDGVLAVWSSGPDESFTRRLRQSGFEVEEVRARASRSKRGARHVIWLARRPDPARAR